MPWIAITGTVLGMVLYSNWLLEFAINITLPDPDAFISELAAADQPYSAWFRGLDLAAAGCLAAAAAAGIARSTGALAKLGWWMLAAFAAATVLDSSVWSLVCAPHSDTLCAAREAAGVVPLGHRLHTLSSITAIAAAFGSLIPFALADVVGHTPGPVRRLGQVVLAALSAATVWTVIAVAIDDTGRDGDVGLAQRAQLLAVAGWLTYLALRSAAARLAPLDDVVCGDRRCRDWSRNSTPAPRTAVPRRPSPHTAIGQVAVRGRRDDPERLGQLALRVTGGRQPMHLRLAGWAKFGWFGRR